MISKRHHARISEKESAHDFILRPDPLVTHSEPSAQIQSQPSRFIQAIKKTREDKRTTVSRREEGVEIAQTRDRGWA